MTELKRFRDEELTAYLDGELDVRTQRDLEAALETDVGLRQRLDALRLPSDAIASAFDDLLATAPAMPALPPAPAKRRRQFYVPAMSAAAGIMVGVWLGAFSLAGRVEAERDWMQYVAAYQALYVDATLTSVNQSDTAIDAELERLGAIMGQDFAAVRRDPNLIFKRGQLLGFEGRELVQLAFLSPANEPVALCIIRADTAEGRGIEMTRLEDMAAAHWTENGFSYLLIGGDDKALIEGAAERFRAAI